MALLASGGMIMRRIQCALLAAVAVIGFASISFADDMPAGVAAANWTGFYGGVTAGGGWTEQSFSIVPGGTLLTVPFDGSAGWAQNLAGSSNLGFTGGGEVGYNWQLSSPIVLGIETDLQYYGANSNNNSSFFSSVLPGTGTLSNQVTSKTPWFGTLRGRIGTTTFDPKFLIFVTGGMAYGHESTTGNVNVTSGGALVEMFPFSTSATHFGVTIGGGVEWAPAPHWSIKAEYLYINLAPTNSQTVATSFLGPSALKTDIMTLSAASDQLNVFRVGLNYRW
ncbi:MAG TPA: outer membrane beta-barrel protein [Stellaceae bacterium]|nr:outer membrane beta-barrel protein [Stellaceae bacterium]